VTGCMMTTMTTKKTTKNSRPNRTKIADGSRNHTCLIFAQVMRQKTCTPAQAWQCFPSLAKDTYETRRSFRHLVRLGLVVEVAEETYKITPQGQQMLMDVVATKAKASIAHDD